MNTEGLLTATLKSDNILSDNKFDFRISDFSVDSKEFKHFAKAYEILIIMSGDGTLTFGKVRFKLSKGSVFFFHDGDSFSVFSGSNTLNIKLVAFSYYFLFPFKEHTVSFLSVPYLKRKVNSNLDAEEFNHLKYVLGIMMQHSSFFTIYNRFTLITCINFIVLSYLVITDGTDRVDSRKTIENAMAYIHNRFITHDFSVSKMAEDLFINPAYLSRLFKKETGMSIQSYVLKLRLELSCDLLIGQKISIQEVAYASGFNSVSYFIKQFKRMYNTTPKKLFDKIMDSQQKD